MRSLILLIIAVALSGCESSEVSELKETKLPGYPTFTIEQAFENRAACGEVTWEKNEDSRGRTVINYECHMDGVDEFESRFLEDVIVSLNNLSEEETPVERSIKQVHLDADYWDEEPDQEHISELEEKQEQYLSKRQKIIDSTIENLKARSADIEPHFVETFRWIKIGDNEFHLDSGGYRMASLALGNTEIDYSSYRFDTALALVYEDIGSYEEYLQRSRIIDGINHQIGEIRRQILRSL